MRGLVPLLIALSASPALAHHEIVMATSALPLLGGLGVIAAAGIAALWKTLRKK